MDSRTRETGPEGPFFAYQYSDTQKREARFEIDKRADPPIDTQKTAITALKLKGHESIGEVGTAGGELLIRLHNEFGHYGPMVGEDPNTSQFPEATPENVELRSGHANDIHIKDESVDVMFANNVLYHVEENNIADAIKKIKSKLIPNVGRAVFTTSGQENKVKHRSFEKEGGIYFNSDAPGYMNENFDTNRAKDELLKHFKNVYLFEFFSCFVIEKENNTEEQREELIDLYTESKVTLASLFDPPLEEDELRKYLAANVKPIIRSEIEENGSFVDYISRSVFIASDNELDDEHLRKMDFIRLEYPELKDTLTELANKSII